MANVSIDVAGMVRLVGGLEEGIETITDSRQSLRGTLDHFGVHSARVWVIGRAVAWAEDELPGVRRRLAMAEALEGADPSWLRGRVEFDEDVISSMSPQDASAAGRDAALALRDGPRARPDAGLIALIVGNQHDPYFASAFAQALSAEELAAVVVRMQHGRAVGLLSPEEWDEQNAWYTSIVSGLSETIATATRATGDIALPASYAEAWVNEITRESREMSFDGDGFPDHANALGMLLLQGRFGTAFLGTVADGVYEYERVYGAEHGAVWRPRSVPGSFHHALLTPDRMPFNDPLAGMMAALGRSPEAAQAFFNAGTFTTMEIDGSQVQVRDRLHYLITERTWGVDPTNGETLGSALEAATTAFRDRGTRGRISAEIASQTFALIGDKTGDGADDGWWITGLGADDGWKMWDGMRPAVARMLASYGADVHRAVIIDSDDLTAGWSIRGSGVLFPDDMPHGAVIDKNLLARIVGTLGEDQDSFTPFLTGVVQANNLAVSTGLQRAVESGGDQAIADFLRGIKRDDSSPAVTNSATVLGWALDTAYTGALSDEAIQQQRMEAVADALSFAAALPFVPEIKPAWVKWGADQVQDATLDAIRNGAPSAATSTYRDLDNQAVRDLTNTTMNLLLQNGYFEGAPLAGTSITPPPEEAIVRSPSGDPLYFAADSEAYRNWFAGSSANSVIAESVVGVYADQWARVR